MFERYGTIAQGPLAQYVRSPLPAARRDAQQSGTGSKWKLSAFAQWMREQGRDFEALWAQVAHIVCKTLIAAQPMLQYQVLWREAAWQEGVLSS